MFNKHGRQTPMKAGAPGLMGRSPSLSAMIPMLAAGGGTGAGRPLGGTREHHGAGPGNGVPNPMLAWNHAVAAHNRSLINFKAQQEHAQEAIRSRLNALSALQANGAGSQALEQLQMQLQEQMMAHQMAAAQKISATAGGTQSESSFQQTLSGPREAHSDSQNAGLTNTTSAGANISAGITGVPGFSGTAGPQTALLAQIAAQMRAFRAQNGLGGLTTPHTQMKPQTSSTGQSLNTTPENDTINEANEDSQIKSSPRHGQECTITEVNSDSVDNQQSNEHEIKAEPIELNGEHENKDGITVEPASPEATPPPGTSLLESPSQIESTPAAKDVAPATSSATVTMMDGVAMISNANGSDEGVASPIKVPSDHTDGSGSEAGSANSDRMSRKRKLDQSIEFGDDILSQRISQPGQQPQIHFPYQMSPFQVSSSRLSVL